MQTSPRLLSRGLTRLLVQLRVLWSLSSETREDLPLETPISVSDALTRLFFLFFFWVVGAVVVETPHTHPNKRLLLTSMSESCRLFSRTGTTPLLGQLLSCLYFPPLSPGPGSFSFGRCKWSPRRRAVGGDLPPLAPRAQRGCEQDLGVMAESLACVSFISFLGGERANFRLSPPVFPAASHLDWLTF